MRIILGVWAGCLLLTSACSAVEPAKVFRGELAALEQVAAAADRLAVEGKDGWLFPASELRFLSVGPFWGDAAASVSRAMKPTSADPLPGIVGFHDALKDRGIELIVVPVPAKAAVYPERITSLPGGIRYDEAVQAFYAALRAKGVQLLDLTDDFMALDGLAYCRTDTHWSPAACALAAARIRALVDGRPWLDAVPRIAFDAAPTEIAITGDLAESLGEDPPRKETLSFTRISRPQGGEPVPVGSDESSPVILMGDSHTIVYQDGSLLAAEGGLPDLLAREFGFELDLQFRNKGSGSSVVRRSLARRQITGARQGEDYLAGKKLVIWCFTARDLTEATDGWPVIPVEKK